MYLHQFSIKTKMMVRDYGVINQNGHFFATISDDSKFLFTSGDVGYIKQWVISNDGSLSLSDDIFTEYHIESIALTKDGNF